LVLGRCGAALRFLSSFGCGAAQGSSSHGTGGIAMDRRLGAARSEDPDAAHPASPVSHPQPAHRQHLADGYSSGATAATIAKSCGLTFEGSNLRTFAVIRVSNSDIVIGGFSPFFDGIQRTGLQRATTTCRRYGLFMPRSLRDLT